MESQKKEKKCDEIKIEFDMSKNGNSNYEGTKIEKQGLKTSNSSQINKNETNNRIIEAEREEMNSDDLKNENNIF